MNNRALMKAIPPPNPEHVCQGCMFNPGRGRGCTSSHLPGLACVTSKGNVIWVIEREYYEPESLPDDNGVDYADGPWAQGWEDRSK